MRLGSCNSSATALVLEDSPSVLSLGRLVEEGFTFEWRAGREPVLVSPDGESVPIEVRDRVPMIAAPVVASPAAQQSSDSESSSSSSSGAPTSKNKSSVAHPAPASAPHSSGHSRRGVGSEEHGLEKRDMDRERRTGNGHEQGEEVEAGAGREPRPPDGAEGAGREPRPPPPPTTPSAKESTPLGKDHYLTHFPKDSRCETCSRCKNAAYTAQTQDQRRHRRRQNRRRNVR